MAQAATATKPKHPGKGSHGGGKGGGDAAYHAPVAQRAHVHRWVLQRDGRTGQPFGYQCATCKDHEGLDAWTSGG